MIRTLTWIGGLTALLVVLVAGRYAYRTLMLWDGRTPEGYQMLTAMPGASGFEPKALPAGPRLENQSTTDLAVNFGYKVGDTPYSYSLVLRFPQGANDGQATLTVRHATRSASLDAAAVRRWDEPRKAFSVALTDTFAVQPAVPALCLKAVIGPRQAGYDLKDASLCIAQRDGSGACHLETLACGLIRQ